MYFCVKCDIYSSQMYELYYQKVTPSVFNLKVHKIKNNFKI